MGERERECQKATERDFEKTIKMTFEHECEEWRISTLSWGSFFISSSSFFTFE